MGSGLSWVWYILLGGSIAHFAIIALILGVSFGFILWQRTQILRQSNQLHNTFRQSSDESGSVEKTPWRDRSQQRLWFVYGQRLGLVIQVGWILNIVLFVYFSPPEPGIWILEQGVGGWLTTVLQFWPTLAIATICYRLSEPVASRVGQLDCTRQQFLTFTILPWVGRILCFSSFWTVFQMLIQLGMFWTISNVELGLNEYLGEKELAILAHPPTDWIGPFCLLVLSLMANRVLQWLAVQALKGHPQTLLTGEFRDRTFALAKQAGVELTQLFVLPTPFLPMANAFAFPDKQILVTDQLLTLLSKQEVDAVIAHELGHLRHQHHGLILMIGLLPIGVFAVLMLANPGSGLNYVFILLILAIPFLLARLRHRIEYNADRHSAQLTQDPKALIVGLARIMQFNPFVAPNRALEQSSSTHPSVMQRVEVLAQQSKQVYAELVLEIIFKANKPVPEGDRYDLPITLQNPNQVWSSADKVRVRTIQEWTVVAALTIPAGLVAWGFSAMAQGWLRSLGFPMALLVTGFACFMASNRVPLLGLGYLQNRLAQQWKEAGHHSQFSHGKFVTLSPDVQPHLYEELWFWDIGFLRIWGDRLYYFGAQTQFCLTRDQIVQLRLGLAEPNGWRSPSLSIVWQNPDLQTQGTFRIERRDLPLRQGIIATRRWKTQLEQWHQRPHAEEEVQILPTFSSPESHNLTRTRPDKRLVGQRLAHLLVQVWLVAWIFCTLAHLPLLETVYVVFVGTLGAIAIRLPEAIAVLKKSYPIEDG